MKFLNDNSHECTKSELDLLLTPDTQTAILGGKWIEVHPEGQIDGDVPIEFSIPADSENYIDLAHTFLYLQTSIIDGKTH